MISDKLLNVPETRPKIPKRINKMSFTKIHLHLPKSFGQWTQISIMAGKAIPKAERQKAPKREMKRPNRGMLKARITEKNKNMKFSYISIQT